MEPVAEAKPVEEIIAELSKVGMLRNTNNGNNEV